ncbi:uncharacterized protein METZ01_LOCUS221339 [marine metagenome]|uniref:Uncharacterized protein n=1 Tax=marine metagenome TaxID=408172 RepID=A0A382G131_9ZZZZ
MVSDDLPVHEADHVLHDIGGMIGQPLLKQLNRNWKF